MGFQKVFGLVLLLFLLSILSIIYFKDYPTDSLKSIATSSLLSPTLLATFRAGCLITNPLVLAWLLTDQEGTPAIANGIDRRPFPILMIGFLRLAPFTVWSWILQAFYFLGALYLQYANLYGISISTQVSDSLYILYEVCFTISILITVIVTFVLIPAGVHSKTPIDNFFTTAALVMHNANVYFMMLELIFNNFDKFHFSHLPFTIIYGLIYVVWGWILANTKGLFFRST